MAISRFVNAERNFVLTTFEESLTNAVLLRHMVEMKGITAEMFGYRELADCTRLTDISSLTVDSVVSAGSYQEGRGSRLALLVNDGQLPFGMARAFQTPSSETSEEVVIFNSRTAALQWLAENDKDLMALSGFVKQFEVEFSQQEDSA